MNVNTSKWGKILGTIFKLTLIALPCVPVICIGVRLVKLVRQLLTLKGVAIVACIVLAFKMVPTVEKFIYDKEGLRAEISSLKVELEKSNSPQTIQAKIVEIDELIKAQESLIHMRSCQGSFYSWEEELFIKDTKDLVLLKSKRAALLSLQVENK